MEEKNLYLKAKKIIEQLSDIIHKRDLQDISELKEWLEENKKAIDTIEMLTDSSRVANEITLYNSHNKENAQKLLRKNIYKHKQKQRIILCCRIAAIFFLLLGMTFLIKHSTSSHEQIPIIASNTFFTTPTLITVNGKNIDLSNISGDSIRYYLDNNSIPNEKRTKSTITTPSNNFNLLIVPRQCNYHIILCDGSTVYLNAESQLEYPNQFSENERKIRLKGEGYFEIKKDSRPFIVEVQQVNIRVYGTKFNIRAYENNEVKTVLVEGKIGVSLQDDPQQEQVLIPSQLSTINTLTRKHEITNTHIEKHVSWVDGFLRYDGERLEELVKDISRWYDIDFFFIDPKLKDIQIFASINKDSSLENIIAMIQITANIKINQIERRYAITR